MDINYAKSQHSCRKLLTFLEEFFDTLNRSGTDPKVRADAPNAPKKQFYIRNFQDSDSLRRFIVLNDGTIRLIRPTC